MSAHVDRIELDSDGAFLPGTLTITLKRGSGYGEPSIKDVPEDLRGALSAWLGIEAKIQAAYEQGWRDSCDDHLEQRGTRTMPANPRHPIGARKQNPYVAKESE